MSSSQIITTSLAGIEPQLLIHALPVRTQKSLNSLSKSLHRFSSSLRYHAYTLWLFTRSDVKTIVVPSTLFASTYTASKLLSNASSASPSPSFLSLLQGLLLTIAWTWLNLLPFTIENQRQPDAILEDAANKPWRPLPARRLSRRAAAALSALTYVLAAVLSAALGAPAQYLALVALGMCYNHGRNGLVARNVLNGCGYVCFTSGALRVMTRALIGAVVAEEEGERAGAGGEETREILPWVLIIGAVVASSIHMLDLPDQIGDRARGRRTVPLVFGDAAARWSVACAVAFWSFCCPVFWELGAAGCAVPVLLGAGVAGRTLGRRSVREDKNTSLLYNVWIAALFCLPLLKSLQAV